MLEWVRSIIARSICIFKTYIPRALSGFVDGKIFRQAVHVRLVTFDARVLAVNVENFLAEGTSRSNRFRTLNHQVRQVEVHANHLAEVAADDFDEFVQAADIADEPAGEFFYRDFFDAVVLGELRVLLRACPRAQPCRESFDCALCPWR